MAARKGDLTPGDVNAMIRMVPFSTMPGVRTLMEYQVKPTLLDAVSE